MIIDFSSVYERYAPDVYRFALYLCGDAALADDIAAETFVRAWVTPVEIRAVTLKAYLFAIARNLYRASLEQQARQADWPVDQPDPAPGPEASAGARLELSAAWQALRALPEIDRAVLLMHVQDDMSYAEIAAVLDLSVAAVKVKVHRSRLKLRRSPKLERGSE
jgi:RNA polymerase sigma-70 factor (ECF subfamily)